MTAANRILYVVGIVCTLICIVGGIADANWFGALGWFTALCWLVTALLNTKRADLR